MALEIVRIPALSDNYIWLVHDPDSGETVVIDPAEAAPVLAAAEARGWRIGQIWNTHWHGDHTGGNAAVKAATGATITGPAAEAGRIEGLDVLVGEGDVARLGAYEAQVFDMPAHTAGHIVFYLPEAAAAFVGDVLFAMGCGRVIEGAPAQMWRNMERLAALPPETQVYCAHEYSQANGRFALTIEPGNADLAARMAEVDRRRAAGEATVPTTIALERATNPFMRAGNVAEFTRRRAAKDVFRG